MTPERKSKIGAASYAYHAWFRQLCGGEYPKRGPLSDRTKANMRRAKTPEMRAKLSRRMSEINERRRRVHERGVVAVIGWDGKITQLK